MGAPDQAVHLVRGHQAHQFPLPGRVFAARTREGVLVRAEGGLDAGYRVGEEPVGRVGHDHADRHHGGPPSPGLVAEFLDGGQYAAPATRADRPGAAVDDVGDGRQRYPRGLSHVPHRRLFEFVRHCASISTALYSAELGNNCRTSI
jgi:hypothetical protein